MEYIIYGRPLYMNHESEAVCAIIRKHDRHDFYGLARWKFKAGQRRPGVSGVTCEYAPITTHGVGIANSKFGDINAEIFPGIFTLLKKDSTNRHGGRKLVLLKPRASTPIRKYLRCSATWCEHFR